MSFRRSLVALFAATAILASGMSPAWAAVSMTQPMACCQAVQHHCHQPHETMRCCAPSGRSDETPLPSSAPRLEPPACVTIAPGPAVVPPGVPALATQVWGHTAGGAGDISPHLLFHVFRI